MKLRNNDIEPKLDNGESQNKRINKNKIVKCAGIGLLTAALTFSAGIAIIDANIDHTKEICPITDVCTKLSGYDVDNVLFNCGIEHQIHGIEQDASKGSDINVRFEPEYAYSISEIRTIEATKVVNEETGVTYYTVPEGYILYGNCGIKTVVIPKEDMAFITTYTTKNITYPLVAINEDGEKIYSAPSGYELMMIDGKWRAVMSYKEMDVLKLERTK